MKTVIEMSKEAGAGVIFTRQHHAFLKRFAELVRADEREACAKMCEDDALSSQYGERSKYRELLAAVMRARGNT